MAGMCVGHADSHRHLLVVAGGSRSRGLKLARLSKHSLGSRVGPKPTTTPI